VQAALRQAFGRWGLPQGLRFDNGGPWGSAGDLPTAFALWLVGLGVDVVFNPPRRPQRNGVVERLQGVSKAWAEPGRCSDAEELQRRLAEADELQRAYYPWGDSPSRLEGCPALSHSGRPYTAAAERRHWELGRALRYLAGFAVPRRIDSGGSVSIYDHNYYVGQARRGQTVWVLLEPQGCTWLIVDEHGVVLREHKAQQLTRQQILGLQVGQRRRRPGRRYYQT
jgi:hypothetical protein